MCEHLLKAMISTISAPGCFNYYFLTHDLISLHAQIKPFYTLYLNTKFSLSVIALNWSCNVIALIHESALSGLAAHH